MCYRVHNLLQKATICSRFLRNSKERTYTLKSEGNEVFLKQILLLDLESGSRSWESAVCIFTKLTP